MMSIIMASGETTSPRLTALLFIMKNVKIDLKN